MTEEPNGAFNHSGIGTIDDDLIRKYDIYAFDYIEYPHKSFWSKNFNGQNYQTGLNELFSNRKAHSLALYVHIPFCEQACLFCICHFFVTHDYEKVKAYLKLLYQELDLLVEYFESRSIAPNFKELHLGGGSPTYLREPEFRELKKRLSRIVDFKNLEEFTIEIDPRRVDAERMRFYSQEGINRISFGVQDFDPEVQKAINRVQSPELLEGILTPELREGFKSVNFDLLCGLPMQTTLTMKKTVEKVVEFAPDRISFCFVHYAPKYAPHQIAMKRGGPLPNFRQRKEIFEEGVRMLLDQGYIRTGFEHFAKPTDEVAKAVKSKTVEYNSLGATTGRCRYLIGLGLHSYSRVGEHYYAQNVYEIPEYEAALRERKFPVFRGHRLSQDDIMRRDIIHKLRSLFALDREEIQQKYSIDFDTYFEPEQVLVTEFVRDGMLKLEDSTLSVTERGKNFSNLVCRIFDKYNRGPRYPNDFFQAPKVDL